MRLMIFIELNDDARFHGMPLDESHEEFGDALSAWIGQNIEVPSTMSEEYNATMAANAAMKEALKQILGSESHGHAVNYARKVLGLIK